MGKISERSPHQRRYMEGKNTWEDAPHMALGNCRLRQDTTAHLSEGPESTTLGTNAGERRSTELAHCWRACRIVQLLWKTAWRLLTKLNIL